MPKNSRVSRTAAAAPAGGLIARLHRRPGPGGERGPRRSRLRGLGGRRTRIRVRHPGLGPLGLEALPVELEHRAPSGRVEPAEARATEVVDEDVPGAHQTPAGRAHAPRVVVVLEKSDLEALVEPAHRLV